MDSSSLTPPSHVAPAANEAQALELPFNIEAEQALLGGLLVDNRLVEDVMMRLRPEHFYEPLHGRIYEQTLRLVDKNMLANPVTLRPLFSDDTAMADLGGAGYLMKLTATATMIAGVRSYADQIYDLALLRELIRVGRSMVGQAADTSHGIEPSAQIEEAELALYRVAEAGEVQGSVKNFTQASALAIEAVARARARGGVLSGIDTGFSGINERIGGFQNSDLLVIAGRPAMGKTALATNMAFSAAWRYLEDQRLGYGDDESTGAKVAFFSLEMSADQLANRILAEQAEINAEALRSGRLNEEQFHRLVQVSGDLSDLPLYIDDTAGLTIAGLRTRARRLKRQKGVGLVFVDYLQLLQGSSRRGGEMNRVQEISEITRGLKTLAKELNIPIVALSQLSRAVEGRDDNRPQLSDLRESGTIEQDSDIVMFIFREEYYHARKKPEEGSDRFEKWRERAERLHGKAELLVSKQRHGATGTVDLHFKREYTKFSDAFNIDHNPEMH